MTDENEPAPVLPPDMARKVLRRNLANLVEKVQRGKPLTNAEHAMMEALAEGRDPQTAKPWARNQVELANALGVSRRSIWEWRKAGAPAPAENGRWNIAAWRAWMKANGKTGSEFDDAEFAVAKKATCRRLVLLNQKLEHEIAIFKGEWTKNEDVERDLAALAAAAKKVFDLLPAKLAPQVVRLSVAEAEKRIRDAVDDALMQLHTGGGAP